jgi:mRNA-degrading endonuclease RelE of RelBE toxin-antitoxin system
VNAAKLAYQNSLTKDEDQFKSTHDLSSVLESLMLLFDFDHILHRALQEKAT